MSQAKPTYFDFYGYRFELTSDPLAPQRVDCVPMLTVGLPCRGRNFERRTECNSILLTPITLAPMALLCPKCYTVVLVEPAASSGDFEELTDLVSRFSLGDQAYAAHHFPIRYLAQGGEDSFNLSLHRISTMRSIIQNKTSGSAVLWAGGAQAEGNPMLSFIARHSLENMGRAGEMIEHMVTAIPRIATTAGPQIARGYAERARTIRPDLRAAREAHWDSMR